MKRIALIMFTVIMLLSLVACGKNVEPWQEQYDLGVRYLSDGNYEEAIIAFTAAIEIDPKQSVLYIGRADAYVGFGETADNLVAALNDYKDAIALDESNADAWLGIADVYIRCGEYEKALEVLKDGLAKTGSNEKIAQKIADMEAGTFADKDGKTRKSVHIENGEVIEYWLYEYDENGYNIRTTNHTADGTLSRTEESEFDAEGLEIKCIETSNDGGYSVTTFEYDSQGRCIKEVRENTHENEYGVQTQTYYTIISYDDDLRIETRDEYTTLDGIEELNHRFVMEYDENWVHFRGSNYRPDENGELYLDYYVEYIWNEDGSYGGFEHIQVAPVD